MHVIYPRINYDNCLDCGKCQRFCPILNPVEKHTPITVFAARSSQSSDAFSGASGGVSTAVFKNALSENSYIVGAKQNNDFSVCLEASDRIKAIESFKNSKYVFSSVYHVFPQISELINKDKSVVVAALPCQIAALRKVFRDNAKLTFIDIVCHGTTPLNYLQQHINYIEKKLDNKATRVYFRDPSRYTYTFTFTLYDKDDHCFYAKRTKDGDTYQYGYHRAITYRENCYHCPFACQARVGDISLADYPGLGTLEPFPHDKKNINSVLVNTKKGELLINKLINTGCIEAYERPIKEVIDGNRQLKSHVEKSNERIVFESMMNSTNADFEQSMKAITRKGLFNEKIHKICILPRRIIKKIKRTFTNRQ